MFLVGAEEGATGKGAISRHTREIGFWSDPGVLFCFFPDHFGVTLYQDWTQNSMVQRFFNYVLYNAGKFIGVIFFF